MVRGTNQVEQINEYGEIICDYDCRLTTAELYAIIKEYFPNVCKNKEHKNYIECTIEEERFLIRVKNITYLGKPHPPNKKRYQIPNDLSLFYDYALENDFVPLMIGVYKYEDVVCFVNFSVESYIEKMHNNSSAHVKTEDLQQIFSMDEMCEVESEIRYGFYEKIDMNGNRITVFDKDSVNYFLSNCKDSANEILQELEAIKQTVSGKEVERIGKEAKTDIACEYDTTRLKTKGTKLLPNRTRNIILNYFAAISKEWNGKTCYEQMFDANYRNQNQAEWPGYYLEYSFEKYLEEKGYTNTIFYAQDKVEGGIDLDLYIEELKTYGDLKAHTESKNDIPGNKKETIEGVLNQFGQVIYIICEHDTELDKNHELEVTKYWNSNKKNRTAKTKPLSYSSRMKYSVKLKRVKILAIDESNVEYLKGFKQGKNSNGKPRKVKIMIDGKHINKFLRLSYEL